jgi:hypothetical protein
MGESDGQRLMHDRPASPWGLLAPVIAVAAFLLLVTRPAAAQPAVDEGAAITPAVAQAVFERLKLLQAPDGCRLQRFDTSRFRIEIGLLTPSGASETLGLAAAPPGAGSSTTGDWRLAAPDDVRRDCPATLAALQRSLAATEAPRESLRGTGTEPESYGLLQGSFVLLVLGTASLLVREARRRRPPVLGVIALALVWGVSLALRHWLSPHTFLHEYYHIAETVPGDLTGEPAPIYGNAGPALFRLVARMLGRPGDYRIIFITNTVVSSLAIPAVALLVVALAGSWPRAICAAVLLCVLPQHLRLSGAEDLFVQAVTLGLWTTGIFVVYLRTRRVDDSLLAALALSLAMQTRPEMFAFPAVLLALAWLAGRRSRRVLLDWRTLLAVAALLALLVPRLISLRAAVAEGTRAPVGLGGVGSYLGNLVLFQSSITPPVYWALLAVGLGWGAVRQPRVVRWAVLAFVGYTTVSLHVFSNPIYDLRSQLLPVGFVVVIASGVAPVWMDLWGHRRRAALVSGACLLAGLGAAIVLAYRGFVTELCDQQLEWAFLQRTVPDLPRRATLLTAVDGGGRDLDAFPAFLLSPDQSSGYTTVDVGKAARGDVEWPSPGQDVLYYQGMFCSFAFGDEPTPAPLTAPCRAVHERYVLEPLFVEEIRARGYSLLHYAGDGRGPFPIGFYALRQRR